MLLVTIIQIQHLLKLNFLELLRLRMWMHSNTTLVKVKFWLTVGSALFTMDSNTTLVKVKLITIRNVVGKQMHSNTTLVKVKYYLPAFRVLQTRFKYNTC